FADAEWVFLGQLPHATVRRVQRAADALIFLGYRGENNGGVVSTKIFEYLALGKPILPLFVVRGSDVDQILRTVCDLGANLRTVGDIADQLATVAREGV